MDSQTQTRRSRLRSGGRAAVWYTVSGEVLQERAGDRRRGGTGRVGAGGAACRSWDGDCLQIRAEGSTTCLAGQGFGEGQAFLLLVAPLAVDAPPSAQPVHTVGVLMPQSVTVYPEFVAFPETLRQLGYQEGRNLRIVLRTADGKLDRLPALATELVSARVDVIVAVNTPGARAAIQATKQIPIVMTQVGDPVGSGFVSNLARPGGNVTGISNMVAEFTAKRLAVLKEIVPSAKMGQDPAWNDPGFDSPAPRAGRCAPPLLDVLMHTDRPGTHDTLPNDAKDDSRGSRQYRGRWPRRTGPDPPLFDKNSCPVR